MFPLIQLFVSKIEVTHTMNECMNILSNFLSILQAFWENALTYVDKIKW